VRRPDFQTRQKTWRLARADRAAARGWASCAHQGCHQAHRRPTHVQRRTPMGAGGDRHGVPPPCPCCWSA